MFVLDHRQESANHINGVAGAYFAPQTLASDFSIEATGRRVIDLRAGMGSLAFAYYHRDAFRRGADLEIVCVEQNPDYVAVGRKVLSEATWILANVLDPPPGTKARGLDFTGGVVASSRQTIEIETIVADVTTKRPSL